MGFASDIAQLAIDDSYAEFGTPAVYAPVAGPEVPCTVIVDVRDPSARLDDGRPLAGYGGIEVRKSEIISPARGDSFTLNGRNVTISDRPIVDDEEGLVWRMWVE